MSPRNAFAVRVGMETHVPIEVGEKGQLFEPCPHAEWLQPFERCLVGDVEPRSCLTLCFQAPWDEQPANWVPLRSRPLSSQANE